jgi:hypothetical protein
MKTYQIELKRVSYVNLTIEAETAEQAEEIAWHELDAHEHRDSDANWEIESIELEEEPETESGEDLAQFYGPSVRI